MDSLAPSLYDNMTENMNEGQKAGLIYRSILVIFYGIGYDETSLLVQGFMLALRLVMGESKIAHSILEQCQLDVMCDPLTEQLVEMFGKEHFEEIKQSMMHEEGIVMPTGFTDTSQEAGDWLSRKPQN